MFIVLCAEKMLRFLLKFLQRPFQFEIWRKHVGLLDIGEKKTVPAFANVLVIIAQQQLNFLQRRGIYGHKFDNVLHFMLQEIQGMSFIFLLKLKSETNTCLDISQGKCAIEIDNGIFYNFETQITPTSLHLHT